MPGIILRAVLLVVFPLFAAAQKADITYYTVADGLPQNTIHSIVQDSQGFIWLNAGQHLTRFDGVKFLSHINTKHPVFNRNREEFREIQNDGDFLLFCANGLIVSINTLTGEETTVPVSEHLLEGYDASNGHCLKLASGAIVAVYPAKMIGKVLMMWLEKGKIIRKLELSEVNADVSNFHYTIQEDEKGDLFFLSKGFDSVVKFDSSGRKVQEFPIQKPSRTEILRIFPGRSNSILLTRGNMIWRLEQGANTFQLHPANQLFNIGTNKILDLLETPEGNFWAACSNRHLLYYHAEQHNLVDYHKELGSHILDFLTFFRCTLDKSGNLWVTSEMGVLRIKSHKALFDTYFTEQNANCPVFCSFRGFAEDEQGAIYTSFYNNVFKLNGPKERQSNYTPLLKGTNGPFDLIFYKGKLMLNNGALFDPKTGQLLNPFPNAPHIHDWGVFTTDALGKIWWGTRNTIYQLNDQMVSTAWDKVANLKETRSIIEDINFDKYHSLLWFCIESSLYTLDPVSKQVKRHGEDQAELLKKLKCIYPDNKGSIWIATESGLLHYNYLLQKWRLYTQADGLSNNIVVGIQPEGDSCLWLSTYSGLSRFSIGSERFINFYKQDGLADNEFNRAGYFTASDGRMYFGGIKGITAFYPKDVMANYAKQQSGDRLLLRSITLTQNGSDSTFTQIFPEQGKPLHVSYENRTLFFAFNLLHPTEHTLYSYKLDGLNEDWSVPTKDHDLLFNSLPAGKYIFRVRAMDARGNWLPEQIAVPLIVHPPWWATWWAYLLYAIFIAGIAYGIFIFMIKRIELQNQLALEHQAAKRLKELDNFKSQFFTNITHEFRTPLTVIIGMAERLNENNGKLTAEDTERGLGLIERNGQNLLRLINQLLDLSKMESNTFQLCLEYGDIVPYMRYLTESFHTYANARNLSLRFFSTLEQLEMDFDSEQLHQVMGNLLSNAIKFTPSGGEIRVELRLDETNLEGLACLKIIVSDTGIGIPEAEIDHIFDRFYQVDGSSTRQGEGTGIGLAHTLELVKLMKGEIKVESKAGLGTTFTVKLPITRASEKEPANNLNKPRPEIMGYEDLRQPISPHEVTTAVVGSPSSVLHAKTDQDNPAILILEDNPDVVYYLKSILEEWYGLDIAYNGRIGIEKALATLPDLIISDVMMPEKDGYQVLDTLKNDERTSHIPILLLTAKADATSKLSGLHRGADAYLPKPFDKGELLATLQMMLENRRRLIAHFSTKTITTQTTAAEPLEQEAIEIEDAFLQKVRQIIEVNYPDESFALPQLCDQLGMSRSQLFRKMKALTDESPSDYIRNYRMQQAKLLLQTNKHSVKEVAYKVGFKDISHFSRTYQDTFGVSPSTDNK
jgi:signal transduction histidine kinase/DNA-binding response OmpR family regulator/ligand-binding sensor domain-containing protein